MHLHEEERLVFNCRTASASTAPCTTEHPEGRAALRMVLRSLPPACLRKKPILQGCDCPSRCHREISPVDNHRKSRTRFCGTYLFCSPTNYKPGNLHPSPNTQHSILSPTTRRNLAWGYLLNVNPEHIGVRVWGVEVDLGG